MQDSWTLSFSEESTLSTENSEEEALRDFAIFLPSRFNSFLRFSLCFWEEICCPYVLGERNDLLHISHRKSDCEALLLVDCSNSCLSNVSTELVLRAGDSWKVDELPLDVIAMVFRLEVLLVVQIGLED